MIKLLLLGGIFLFFVQCSIFSNKEVLVEGIEEFPSRLDPAHIEGVQDVRIMSAIYESLVTLGPDQQTILPLLAERWETSLDQKIYLFYLKSGVRFHDLSRLDAEAVSYGFRRQIQLNASSPLFNMIDEISAPDSLILEIRLKFPYVQFLHSLTSHVGLKVISKKALQVYGEEIGRHPAGTGPFRLKEWKTDREIRLQAFDEYHAHRTGPDQMVFRYYQNYFELERDLRDQKLDVFYGVPGFSIDRLRWLGIIDYKITAPTTVLMLGFNCSHPILKDHKVRQAILQAINITELVTLVLRGNSLVADGPLLPVWPLEDRKSQAGFDLSAARDLLSQAGMPPDGLTLTLFYQKNLTVRSTLLEAIKSYLGRLNIRVELVPFDSWDELTTACRSDSAQMSWLAWQTDVLGDAENFLYSLFYSGSEFNFFHYRDRQVDDWLEQARREPDRDKRNVLYRRISDQVVADTPAVFLYQVLTIFAYNRNRIRDLPANSLGIIHYHQVVLND